MLFRVEALQYCGRLTSDVHLLQFVTFPSALPLNEFLYICTGLFHDQTLFALAPRFIFIAWQFHLYNTENMKKDDTRMKFVLMETKKLSFVCCLFVCSYYTRMQAVPMTSVQ